MAIKLILINISKCFLAGLLLIYLSTSSYAFPYKGLDLKIDTSVAESYDDNLLFEKDNTKEDFITTLSLGLAATYEGKRRSLGLTGLFNYRFNARYSDIKNDDQRLALNFRNEFSAYDRITLNYNISRSHSPQSFEEALGRNTPRRESYRHNVSLDYSRNISEHYTISASYGFSQNLFPDEGVSDTYSNSYGLTLRYWQGPETSYSLSGRYSRNNFGNSTQSVSLGAVRYITKRLYLNGSAGLSTNSENSNPGLTTNISLTNQIDQITTLRLYVSRRDQFAAEGGAMTATWRGTGEFTRQLSNRLNCSFNVYYGISEYSDTEIADTLTGAFVNFGYSFKEDFSGSINYVYADLDSDNEARNYTKNIIKIALKKTF